MYVYVHVSIVVFVIIFERPPANSQAITQILSRRENNWLQRTSWQWRYFEKKRRFPFEVPRTASETDTQLLLRFCCSIIVRSPVIGLPRQRLENRIYVAPYWTLCCTSDESI